ncbi:unnamed protein product [Trifolium pratense]|uniref:Uncharacterized protein n=1 Tax=Trifolium pratense TaxID=57577 RepID=A0ACB0IJX2_TRIPR|nr:unnamed protein product [Trifolium pratense]
MDTIISFVGSIAPNALAPIRREVSYLIRYERNFTKLSGSVRDLQALGEEIKHRVEAERRNGKIIEVVVQNWLVEVNEVIERANQLLEDPRRREVGCSGCSFPNLILRHKLGKKATKIANDVVGVKGRRSDFNEVGYLPALYEIASSSATCVGEKFKTRELFKEGILKALKDPKARNIGVYGFGGVGKSFLVKEVTKIAKQQELFIRVAIVHVSKTPDIKKIQVVIADMLGLTFLEESTDARAIRLRQRIEAEKSVLIILDDIWQPLDLEKVGIPSNKEHVGCKLLMTSRTQDVLQQMDVQKDFRLEVLSEVESWSLFQSMAEEVVNDISLNNLATQIAKQCKGLPLLIRTMASGLKSKDISAWKDALNLLQSVGHVEMEDIALSALELNYKWLASDEIKALFLLCAVLESCRKDYLLKVAMGLDIFKNISTVNDARNRLHSIIESLEASCLLLEGNKRSLEIQMHDLVRDVGISIARRDKHVYMLKPKAGLKECLPKNFPEMCSQIILSQCLLHELPKKIDCPNVKLFYLNSADRSLEISDTIFDGMGSLKVLDLTCLNLSSLPTSFCSLTGLQTLCLEGCVLENIDIIGDLKNLEILSLSKSSMIKLPSKIREMTQLRMLDLSNAGLEIIPPNIISSLSNLEELYMGNTSITWEDENSQQKQNASLAELQRLCNLTALELQIHEARILPKHLTTMFEKLQRYKIAIGYVWDWSDIKDTTLKTLMLKLDTNIHLELGIKALIKGVENLYMDEVDGIHNVLYEMNREGFPLLSHLHIQNNPKMKHIVYSLERNQVHVSFPKLDTLSINNLENLEQICHGPLAINSFGNLSVIKVKKCAKLTYLLSLSMVKSLSNLSEIEVCQCNSMKNIVLGDLPDEKVEFPSLRSLTLQHLDTLDNFFSYELTSSITSTSFFSAQVAFPDLTTLKLSSLNLDKIWNDNQHSMYNLSVLIVENCGQLKYLFSSTMVETFVNLKRVEISKCNLMNEIIATERRNDVTIALNEVPFPKLETIVVKDMENLKTVWHYQFDTVKTLEVENCEKIVVVFPSSMQKTYHNLEMLVVKDCALVENIFELSSSENSSIESATQLKVINLAQLPKLIKIWSIDPEGILSFHNLQNLYLNGCKSMEYVFPFSVATGCPHLEQLKIKRCWEIKEIVSEKRQSMCASPTFEFNKLNTIVLWGLYSLKGFYAESHILACPSLTKLDVSGCAKLNLYKTVALSGSIPQRCQDENLSNLFQPLFIVEEVIPNLESMNIDDRDAMIILQSQNLDSLFNKLTSLGLYYFENEEATFPFWFLQNAHSLENLLVEWSSFKKIFEDERPVSKKIHTQLKTLILKRLHKLQHICEDGSLIHPVLEHLEQLVIDDCPSLTNLLPSSVTFSHLTCLWITKCNKLVNLITSSTAQSLVKLGFLIIEDCDSLQEIIMGKENVDIAFVSLQFLMIKGLLSLNNFCSSKSCLKFPLLEYVVVSNCPRMKIFSEGNTSTPSLRKVRIEDNGEEWYWKGNLNNTIKEMFEDKVAFCKFKDLNLSKYPELKDWWYGDQLPHNMFCNLKSLVVQRCDFLSDVLFPSNVLQVLHGLENLEVRNCDTLEALFDVKGFMSKQVLTRQSSQLKKLVLSKSPNLKHIWNDDPYENISFGKLSSVDISMCQSLLYIFPLSLCQDLEHLKTLLIKSSGVEQIVAMEETSTENITITFPQLTIFGLFHLEKLTSFYPGKHTLECPSLKILNVYRCEALNMFSFNHFNIQQHDDEIIQQALFSIEKLNPNLEELAITREDAFTILRCYSDQKDIFSKLEFLRLQCFYETPIYFLNDFQAILPNLASLQVRNSSFKTLFPTTATINDLQNLQKIRTLLLFELEKLECIWQEDFPLKNSLPQDLKTLRVVNCPRLTILVPSSTSFTSLTFLKVKNCKELVYLISSSTAKSLVQLTTLKIKKCDKLLDVVNINDEENIIFENLEHLELTSLSSFRSFCYGKHKFIFPSLISFIVKRCPQMKIFSPGVTTAPYLTSVQVENEDMRWKIDLNTTILQLFMEKSNNLTSQSAQEETQ